VLIDQRRWTLVDVSGALQAVVRGTYDAAAGVIREGGRAHAANTAVPDVSHPGIEDFVAAKSRLGTLCPQAC
jgi:hypothetical protein